MSIKCSRWWSSIVFTGYYGKIHIQDLTSLVFANIAQVLCKHPLLPMHEEDFVYPFFYGFDVMWLSTVSLPPSTPPRDGEDLPRDLIFYFVTSTEMWFNVVKISWNALKLPERMSFPTYVL